MNLSYWLNSAWMWMCRREAGAFHQATRAVAKTQAAVLQEILAKNQYTEYGAANGFGGLRSPAEFQRRVPLSTYDTYGEPIRHIAAGKPNVLTAERVQLLEPTSGTTSAEKLIPYTPMLRRQFQRAIAAWIADLMQHRPAIRHGRAYWSISPALGPGRRTDGGIPIGFDNDTAYLGHLEQIVLNRLLVVPSSIARVPDIENFRYCTLLHLLQADDLALISIWNPTFLTALLKPIEKWSGRMCSDLRQGSLSLPNPSRGALPGQLIPRHRSDGRRVNQLASILASGLPLVEKLKCIWPRLTLISCWTDSAARRCVPELRELFPAVEIQPKGLLATEGCVSFPLADRPGAVLAVRSHFFEFEEIDGGCNQDGPQELRLAHELETRGKYRVVLTTGGGLYRYRLGDVVEVVGFENQCPLLRFIGRMDRVTDLVGEKLSEPHVREVLDHAFAAHGVAPRFALVVPVAEETRYYRLYVQGIDDGATQSLVDSLAASIQAGLEENPHYRHAVRLGQLAPLRVHVLAGTGEPGWAVYERGCLARGQKPGDIKPTALDSWTGWPIRFAETALCR